MSVHLRVDGVDVEVFREDVSLLAALRDELGVRSPKDGCSPQGQCGCCTVLVDGVARVSCVTAVRRVAGRSVTTVEGLAPEVVTPLVDALVAAGGSQCGFCTPGIICRLAALGPSPTETKVENALLAHLCRCTGWRTIVEAVTGSAGPTAPESVGGGLNTETVTTLAGRLAAESVGAGLSSETVTASADRNATGSVAGRVGRRDFEAAARRAGLEGGSPQRVGAAVATGHGRFADDTSPLGALVAVPDGQGGWAVGETVQEARDRAGKVSGRRSGRPLTWPVDLPPGDWAVTLQTTWTEPAYLEPDASWCEPGGTPASPLANGGAFGGKTSSAAPAAARMLADRHGRAVRILYTREDVVRLGPKRPPIAAGLRRDGTGVLRLVATPGLASAVTSFAPGIVVESVTVPGPPTSSALRAAGWAEAAVLLAAVAARRDGRVAAGPVAVAAPSVAAGGLALPTPPVAAGGVAFLTPPGVALPTPPGGTGWAKVVSPAESTARAEVKLDGAGRPVAVQVEVAAGDPLDDTVLRSYAVGATHMALGWVLSEGVAVDGPGDPEDLTIRSWGVLRARDTPVITVTVAAAPGPPRNGSDAVFAAVAAAAWIAQGLPPRWPTHRGIFQ